MKVRLIAAVLTLVLVCSLAGVGTMAWFTSSATSNVNTFESGRLEIRLGMPGEIPKPLFKTSYDKGKQWDVGLWYPGKVVNDGRSLVVINSGTMPLRICGVSANITRFQKNSTVYNPGDPNLSRDIKDAYNEFTDKMIIRVKRGNTLLYQGSLKSLTSSVQSLLKLNKEDQNSLLEVEQPLEYDFEAEMLPEAGNAAQGASATVDLVMHATQDNKNAITALVGE
ncbi:MAG TPA: SipW-dependent-type signal peptide-containing protein [Candidatus Nitrosocosmicus sp.]|nr:SipW-dependent-type signal peptide-containing protein [Candidatus Nitrosocosmicus sp.]